MREEGSDAIYPLASGWLKASHRTLDDARIDALGDRPRPHQGRAAQPGEINEYTVQLRPMSHLFRAGKRIKLEISEHRHPHRHRDLRRHVARLQQRDDPAQDLSRRQALVSRVATGDPRGDLELGLAADLNPHRGEGAPHPGGPDGPACRVPAPTAFAPPLWGADPYAAISKNLPCALTYAALSGDAT